MPPRRSRANRCRFAAARLGTSSAPSPRIAVYASGGYRYPSDDLARLRDEARRLRDAGYRQMKIKIGAVPLDADLRRIETVLESFAAGDLAVDAMNNYDATSSAGAADALAPYGLRWFEDICDPHDFATQRAVAARYPHPIAAGEALFSAQEAALLADHGGLRAERDVLLFDPAHCYGLPGFHRIVETMVARGWPRTAFWPHGGHLYTLHVAAALGLGGSELNPLSFAPFGGPADATPIDEGHVTLTDAPGIGFETKRDLYALLKELQN